MNGVNSINKQLTIVLLIERFFFKDTTVLVELNFKKEEETLWARSLLIDRLK